MSWYDHGMPVTNDPDVLCTAELIRRLYGLPGCGMGGPLHAMLDDGNIDDEQVESDYYGATDGRTTETYLCKHRMVQVGTAWRHVYDDVLHPPQGVADLCRLILASMRRMSEPWRAAAIAWADGTIARNLPILVDNPKAACEASAEQVDAFIVELRQWIEQGEVSGPKACVPISCPDFEPVNLRTRYERLFADGPSVLLADVPSELLPVAEQFIQDHAPVVTPLPGGGFEVSSPQPPPFAKTNPNAEQVPVNLRNRYEQVPDAPGVRVTKLDEHGQPVGEPVTVSGWADVGIQVDEPDPEHPRPTLKWVETTFTSDDPALRALYASVLENMSLPPQVDMGEVLNRPPSVTVPKIVRVPRGISNEQAHKLVTILLEDGLLAPSEAGWLYLPDEVAL